jgi:hypothetical protein
VTQKWCGIWSAALAGGGSLRRQISVWAGSPESGDYVTFALAISADHSVRRLANRCVGDAASAFTSSGHSV